MAISISQLALDANESPKGEEKEQGEDQGTEPANMGKGEHHTGGVCRPLKAHTDVKPDATYSHMHLT